MEKNIHCVNVDICCSCGRSKQQPQGVDERFFPNGNSETSFCPFNCCGDSCRWPNVVLLHASYWSVCSYQTWIINTTAKMNLIKGRGGDFGHFGHFYCLIIKLNFVLCLLTTWLLSSSSLKLGIYCTAIHPRSSIRRGSNELNPFSSGRLLRLLKVSII